MHYAPIARIVLRYVAGAIFGASWLADDPDVVAATAIAIGALVEGLYAVAVKRGWAR